MKKIIDVSAIPPNRVSIPESELMTCPLPQTPLYLDIQINISLMAYEEIGRLMLLDVESELASI